MSPDLAHTFCNDQPTPKWRLANTAFLGWTGSSKEAIFTAFEELGALGIGMSPAGGLDVAEMYAALGRESDARRTTAKFTMAFPPSLRGYSSARSPSARSLNSQGP